MQIKSDQCLSFLINCLGLNFLVLIAAGLNVVALNVLVLIVIGQTVIGLNLVGRNVIS